MHILYQFSTSEWTLFAELNSCNVETLTMERFSSLSSLLYFRALFLTFILFQLDYKEDSMAQRKDLVTDYLVDY